MGTNCVSSCVGQPLHDHSSHNFFDKHLSRVETLNPKCISMGELYGQFHELTQEWTDGLASSLIRKASSEENPQKLSWIVFDGPIDALWIENMNTVLDDNMTLCLASSERIR